MKEKFVWLVASGLVVVALLAAACAPAPAKEVAPVAPAVKETAPAVKEAAPAVKEAAPAEKPGMIKVTLTKADGTVMEKLVEKPKYGGVYKFSVRAPVYGFDETTVEPWKVSGYLSHTNQDLLMGSWMRGWLGTNEKDWSYGDWISLANVAGELAESWELAGPDTIIYHIRKGVRWQNKPPVNGREFTADDAVFNIKRIYMETPTATMYTMLGDGRPTEVYAKDKYTVVMKAPPATIGDTLENVSDLTKMYPPEVIKKYGDMNKWENVVGTGPFILVDHIEMSSTTWKRNPNYWQHDPIRGADYPLPYLEGIKLFNIPDTSTEMAAIRTGKIDSTTSAYVREDWQQIMRSRPDIGFQRSTPTGCTTIGFTLGRGLPYDDIRVRKAMIMAVDRQEIVDTYYGGDAVPLPFKVPPHPATMKWYTPLEEMPPEIKEIYTYNPVKAKQLLTEAGYPNGFKTEVVLSMAYPGAAATDILTIVKAYWAKNLNVDLKLDIKEFSVMMGMRVKKTYKEMYASGRGQKVPSMYYCRKGTLWNTALIDDPKIEDYYYPEVGKAYFDQPKKDALMKEMNLYVLSQAWYWPFPSAYSYRVWQPWVKDFHGDSVGFYSSGQEVRYLWLDQELKKSLGY